MSEDNMIGFDPLSWFGPGEGQPPDSQEKEENPSKTPQAEAAPQGLEGQEDPSTSEPEPGEVESAPGVEAGPAAKVGSGPEAVEEAAVADEDGPDAPGGMEPSPEESASAEGEPEETPGDTAQAQAVAEGPADNTVRLGPLVDIHRAAEIRQELLDALNGDDAIYLDASAVEEADTAGLQILAAFVRDAGKQGRPVRWQAVSPALRSSAELAGLADILPSD